MKHNYENTPTLLSVINVPIKNVCLDAENDSAYAVMIPVLGQSMFMEQGLEEYADVLNLPVREIRSGVDCTILKLGPCSTERMAEFENLLLGRCSEHDYDSYLRNESWRYMPEDIEPMHPRNDDMALINIISAYEDVCEIPAKERIVGYFECSRSRCFMNEASDEDIAGRYDDAMYLMGLSEWNDTGTGDDPDSRHEIISRMRDSLLAEHLQIGEKVLFAATEPYGGPGDFALRGGIVESIDAANMTCSVKGDFFTMDDVPLHYILGRYNPEITGVHYGNECVEPLFGEFPALAHEYLQEAEEAWEEQCASAGDISM